MKYYKANKFTNYKNSLNFGNTKVNETEFHKSKKPFNLDSANVDQLIISVTFKHNDDGFKYFIGDKGDDILKPLYYLTSNEWRNKLF